MEEAPEVPTQVWEDYALHLEILEHQLKLDTGLPLLIDVARGTQYLHEHFIIHGDLKPDNILLKTDSAAPKGFLAKITGRRAIN
eukprot:scaffold61188_cov22-Tisochrysis_lutea.AAC.1